MKNDQTKIANQLPDKLVLEFFDRVWHAPHELDAIDELMTEDYRITTAGKVIIGRTAFKNWVTDFHRLLLDAKTESIDVFYNEQQDKVVSRWVCSGRNNGLFGLEADGRFVSFSGIAIWSICDNRLSECWAERSAHELYQDLISGKKENSFV
ncbi:SnoaL-like polyketide cyclase [Flavobacteriaceae bacterium MAR_2010_105]|nr:SnoaL-like polyketide cyclase [Flavobacteriaceae bacterium MAR_2010_105]